MEKREKMCNIAECLLHNMENDKAPAHHVLGFSDYYNEDMPWCMAFVSMCADMVGLNHLTKFMVDCDSFKNHLISLGRFDATKTHGGGNYRPSKGDIVFISSKENLNDITHVAIIYEYCCDGNFRIIEGNFYDKMSTRVLNVNNKTVCGFGNMGG